jgi:hypothetical protein
MRLLRLVLFLPMVFLQMLAARAGRVIVDYKVVTNAVGKGEKSVLFSLQSSVKREMARGWQPLGPVSVGTRDKKEPPHNEGLAFYQTMVKYEDNVSVGTDL